MPTQPNLPVLCGWCGRPLDNGLGIPVPDPSAKTQRIHDVCLTHRTSIRHHDRA